MWREGLEIFFWRASYNNPIIINSIQEYFGFLCSMYFYKKDELNTSGRKFHNESLETMICFIVISQLLININNKNFIPYILSVTSCKINRVDKFFHAIAVRFIFSFQRLLYLLHS